MPRGPKKVKAVDPQKALISELSDLLESGKIDKYLNDDLRIKVYDGKYDEVKDVIAKIKGGTKVQPQMVANPAIKSPPPAPMPTKEQKPSKEPKVKKPRALPELDDLLKQIKSTAPVASVPQGDDVNALIKQAETKMSKPKKEPKPAKEPKHKKEPKSSSKVFSEIKKHASSIVKLVDETI